jgi:hypothetical protein
VQAAEYNQLPPKKNWMPERGGGGNTSSIIFGCDDPPAPLVHFAVGVVHALKVYR